MFNHLFIDLCCHTAITSVLAELMLRSSCLLAAINLHKSILCGILRAPITYFDQTPSGRILSRFSKDIDVLDIALPESLKWLLYCSAEVISYFTDNNLAFLFKSCAFCEEEDCVDCTFTNLLSQAFIV